MLPDWFRMPLASFASVPTSDRLRSARRRALAVSAVKVVIAGWLLWFVPVPDHTEAHGVVWVPDDAIVRATANGLVDAFVTRPGEHVRRGQPLFTLRDERTVATIAQMDGRRREVPARFDAYAPADRVRAELAAAGLRNVDGSLGDRPGDELTVVAGSDGTFILAAPDDLPGRYVRRGELVGYVVELGAVTVRATVPQADIEPVRDHTRAVEVRLAEHLGESVPAIVRRVDRVAPDRVFQVDVELQQPVRHVDVGGRAYLRFDHGRAPLARQWSRKLRQLFLARFQG